MQKHRRQYVIYQPDSGEERNVVKPTLPLREGITFTLAEAFNSSPKESQVGDRVLETKKEGGKSYYRVGDWKVSRIDTYVANIPIPGQQEFDEVVICYCTFDPIDAPWSRQGKGIVSVDSFGGGAEGLAAFDKWYAETKGTPEFQKYDVKVPHADGCYRTDNGTYEPGSLDFTPEQFEQLGRGFRSMANASTGQ